VTWKFGFSTRRFAGWLAVLGAWAAVAPYTASMAGVDLGVSATVEAVDHVLPGTALILIAGALQFAPFEHSPPRVLRVASAAAFLPAFWIVATHRNLILHPFRFDGGLAAPLLHATPGVLAVAVSALAWFLLNPRAQRNSLKARNGAAPQP
jgi:hypothetical protein